MRARRGHHRHPRQPAGARGGARARSSELGIERGLLRRRPRRLRPAPERGLRADRGARRSRRSTATTTTRSPATSRTAAAPTATSTTASSASARSTGRSRTPTGARRTSCASCRSTCASSSASTRVRLVHGSPRKVNEYLFEDKPARTFERIAARRRLRRARLRPHPPALDRASTAACCSSTAARSASPRTATRAPPSRCSTPTAADVQRAIERVEYDAEAVAREVARGRAARRVRRQAGARGLRAEPWIAHSPLAPRRRRGPRRLRPRLRRLRRDRRRRALRRRARNRRHRARLRPGHHGAWSTPPATSRARTSTRRSRSPSRSRATSRRATRPPTSAPS